MKSFTPTNRIPSAHAAVENSGQIKVSKRVGWEMQRTIPAHIKANILAERHAKALRMGY